MREKIKNNKYIWIAFLIAFLPRLLFLVKTYPVSITGDEMFAIWPAAKFLGYDWSGVMQDYRYYGYGYTVLWIPFMALIKNPVILYRCMAGLMALCQALVAPISYHLLKKYFGMSDEKQVCLISVTCSYLVAVRATYTYPEFVYVLVIWLITWVLLKLTTTAIQEQQKAKAIYTVILFGLMAYAYTVHSRGVTAWAALAITVILYAWIYRKICFSVPVCVVVGIPAFVAVGAGINRIIGFLGLGQAGHIGNTSAKVSSSVLELFFTPKTWTAWADIIIGELNESVVLTGGIAVAVVVVICVLIWRAVRREKEVIQKEKSYYLPYIVVGIFCICAIGITIGGQSLKWLRGVTNLIENNESGDSFRAITYLRYYAAYIGPLFMAGVAYIIQNTEIIEKFKGKILLIAGLLQGYWVFVILPVLCYELGCVWSYAPFSLTPGFAAEAVGAHSYLPATIFVVIFMFGSYLLFKHKKLNWIIGLLCVVLIYTYAFNGMFHERYRGEQNYQYCKDAVEWIETAEDKGIEIDKIYVSDEGVPATWMSEALEYQFLMPKKKVISGAPEIADGIYLCRDGKSLSKEMRETALKIRITDDIYAYVWGEELQKGLQKME